MNFTCVWCRLSHQNFVQWGSFKNHVSLSPHGTLLISVLMASLRGPLHTNVSGRCSKSVTVVGWSWLGHVEWQGEAAVVGVVEEEEEEEEGRHIHRPWCTSSVCWRQVPSITANIEFLADRAALRTTQLPVRHRRTGVSSRKAGLSLSYWSVEAQPGRAHTRTHTLTHTHLAGSATDRPPSTPPQLSQFTELCHRTSPTLLPHLLLPLSRGFVRRLPGWQARRGRAGDGEACLRVSCGDILPFLLII